jgi:hypothetical protein
MHTWKGAFVIPAATERVGQEEPEDAAASPVPLEILLTQVETLLRRPGRLFWVGASPALPTLWFFWPPWFAPDRRGRFLETRRAYLEALREVLCRIERLRRVPDPARQGQAFWLAEHLRAELQERLTWYEIRPGPTWPPWDGPVRSSRAGRSRGADPSSTP